ncbi:MAG: flagellar FlbD family protein [Candidatus Latescibacterota bacterium]|nr:flagellar FlbD family protein [Candidatus Latescibacterota bacterium]
MVKITRLNGTILVVNSDLIEFLESTPDTIVTLTTGRKVIAKESVDELIDKVVEYKRQFLQNPPEVRSR